MIQNYVEFYQPEVKDPAIWRDHVVGRINECLRRPKVQRPRPTSDFSGAAERQRTFPCPAFVYSTLMLQGY